MFSIYHPTEQQQSRRLLVLCENENGGKKKYEKVIFHRSEQYKSNTELKI